MRAFIALALLVVSASAIAEWQPDPGKSLEVEAADVLQLFKSGEPDLAAEYLGDSVGYAVFPVLKRGGLLFGWASGTGVLVEGDAATGIIEQRRFSFGAQVGYQKEAQIIFFKTQDALDAFKKGTVEFDPAASATAGSSGGMNNGSFNPDVAIFAVTQKGLMAEAAAAASRYKFKPY